MLAMRQQRWLGATFHCFLAWNLACCLGVKLRIGNFAATTATVENTCQLETINSIEFEHMAKDTGVPVCSLDMFVVSATSGQIFLKGSEEAEKHEATNMHYYGTFSAPWYLYHALVDSLFYTDDSSRTSLYFVNDYCYLMWWLAASSSHDPNAESPLKHLLQLYEAMTESPAWQVSDGANFVFFIPYGISHVLEFEKSRSEEGELGQYIDFICETFDQALLITSENFQTNALCTREKTRKTLVAPFVPNVIDVKNQALTGSLEAMRRSIPQLEDRENLIYFMGRCSHRHKDPARALRLHVVEALAHAGPDVKLTCTEAEGKERIPFSQMLTDMEGSVFCLIIPMSSQTARVLGEAMLAGCIPVFLGPPFAALPFHKDLDYSTFSLSYYLESHELWTIGTHSNEEDASAQKANAKAIALTSRGKSMDERFGSVHEVIEALRDINDASKQRMLQAVQAVKQKFLYHPELSDEADETSSGSATDLLMLQLCQHINALSNE